MSNRRKLNRKPMNKWAGRMMLVEFTKKLTRPSVCFITLSDDDEWVRKVMVNGRDINPEELASLNRKYRAAMGLD